MHFWKCYFDGQEKNIDTIRNMILEPLISGFFLGTVPKMVGGRGLINDVSTCCLA